MPPCVPNISKHHLVKPLGIPLRLMGIELTYSLYRWENPTGDGSNGWAMAMQTYHIGPRSEFSSQNNAKCCRKGPEKLPSKRAKASFTQDARWVGVINWQKRSKHIPGGTTRHSLGITIRHSVGVRPVGISENWHGPSEDLMWHYGHLTTAGTVDFCHFKFFSASEPPSHNYRFHY